MVRTGLSALSGSCGMKAMRRPSRARRSDFPSASRLVPLNVTSPAETEKFSGSNPDMVRPIMLLPAPDLPTRPIDLALMELERDVAQHIDLAAANAWPSP